MLDDNEGRILLGVLAVGVVLAPIMFLFYGDNWDQFMELTDKYSDTQNVNR